MGFTLPARDTKGTEDINNTLADFHLGTVTDKFGHGATVSDMILEGVDKLAIRFHAIHISEHGAGANKELSNLRTIINSRSVRVYRVCSNGFITPVHIVGRVG